MGAVVRKLHDGPLLRIEHYQCGGGGPECGPEEAATTPEIVFPLRGVFVRELRGRTHVADVNQVLFFEPDEGYRVHHPAGCGDACLVLGLKARRDEARHALGVDGRLVPSHRLVPVAVRLGVARLTAALAAGDDLADELAWDVVSSVLPGPREEGRDATPHHQAEIVAAVQLALARQPRAPLSSLAAQTGVSTFHLSRLFRRHTGAPLRAYRNRMRVAEAALRLAAGERDLARLACELGFADHGHFTRVFKATSGLNPSRFRQRARAARA